MKQNRLLIITIIVTVLYMPVMIFVFVHSAVYAGNMRLDDLSYSDGSDAVNMTLDVESDIRVVDGIEEGTVISLGIPLDYETETDKIGIYEDKAESLIVIKIPTEDKSFYYRNELTGSQKGIDSVVFDYSDNTAEFRVTTDGYYIPILHLIPNELYLELNTPKELYGHVYLIDAAHGGEDTGNSAYGVNEKDVTLGIAKAVSDVAAATGVGGIYLTRSTDEAVSEADRLKLIELLNPDIYVTIHTDSDGETRVTNGIRGVTNDQAELNDVRGLIAVLAQETGQQDLGVTLQDNMEGGDGQELPLREVEIYTGYVTNKAEAMKMSEETYALTVAKVIYAWLMQEDNSGQ